MSDGAVDCVRPTTAGGDYVTAILCVLRAQPVPPGRTGEGGFK